MSCRALERANDPVHKAAQLVSYIIFFTQFDVFMFEVKDMAYPERRPPRQLPLNLNIKFAVSAVGDFFSP